MGAEISPIANDGHTPLRCSIANRHNQSAEHLLQHGAADELAPAWFDQHGVKLPNIIELAFNMNDHALFALLLQYGAQPYSREGKSLLTFAQQIIQDGVVTETGRENMIKILNLCQEWHRQHKVPTDPEE